ncbi:alpha-mannosidase [Vigna unguiculata]|uniref:Alpha-mannosidase n=1 Tax=Vigna unguiculata TaxID=3917 RepID=A0A4D6M6N9_VIGUN|nr:alpha-mannosidase [Vigna unguiculata]
MVGSQKKKKNLPIGTTFKLPADIPIWPQGGGFATGTIDLGGGLLVSQITTFNKVWTSFEGGPNNLGVTFFEPTGLSEGFFMLGCYCQPNNKPLHGWVLVGKDNSSLSNGALAKPVDYNLVWTTRCLKKKQDEEEGYIWLPIAPDEYKPVGYVVTTSPEKPSLDRIRCVRSYLTDECTRHHSMKLWRTESKRFGVFDVRPMKRGIEAEGVSVGTFLAQSGGGTNTKPLPIACLKNTKAKFSYMPNLSQVEAMIKAYSPYMYLHPMEEYLPSSVDWFFSNGAVLMEKRKGVTRENAIKPNGSNLPQGGSFDDEVTYWLDLPLDEAKRDKVKKGDLASAEAYVHVKAMLGGSFSDIVMWVFYPFNGGARAKVACTNIPLRRKGEHVGDWEHVTLRVSNFNGELWKVYLSQHSGGEWVDACELEFQNGNRVVAYSSLHGHALFSKPGVVMQGMRGLGVRNDAAKSDAVMDMANGFQIVGAECLGSQIREAPWLNYCMNWGPKDGPKGPKQKDSWEGDERCK